MNLRQRTNAAMQALIDGVFGCLDAAADTINARTGGSCSKGTLSKRLHGALGWTIEDVIALEDAAGSYPVTRMMARRLDATAPSAAASVYAASGVVSKEVGEAISAALSAEQSADAGELVQAIHESAEGIEAAKQLHAALEARLSAAAAADRQTINDKLRKDVP